MLTSKRTIEFKGCTVGTTPMLLPSFSSRLNLDFNKTIDQLSEIITGPFLISAYDLAHTKEKIPSFTFSDLLFLDSGGYECSVDHEISDIGMYKPPPNTWSEESHREVVNNWKCDIPTVIISYDNPLKRESLDEQIINANKLFEGKSDVLREFLIKPTNERSNKINIPNVLKNLDKIDNFDIIGFTEKELGSSVLERMKNIATIRTEMNGINLDLPIHIFGSLDSITTPLYYMSGADIFDGLSWLRFVYDEKSGYAGYINCIGPKNEGIQVNMRSIWTSSIYSNYNYLRRLEIDLIKFNDSEDDFSIFGENEAFFKKSCTDLESIGGL